MKVIVVRSSEPGCEPVCAEWIAAEGEITPNSDDKFRAIFKKLGKRRLPIVLNSVGGDVDAAMAIGRMIRKRKVDVLVGSTGFLSCDPLQRKCEVNRGRGAEYFGRPIAYATCNSACPLILAGGFHRYAGSSTFVGLHQITTTYTETPLVYETRYKTVGGKRKVIDKKIVKRGKTKTRTVTRMEKGIEKSLRAYLREMNVDPILVDRMKATAASEIGFVDLSARRSSRLVDSSGSIDALLGSRSCTSVPAASHCRLITTDDL